MGGGERPGRVKSPLVQDTQTDPGTASPERRGKDDRYLFQQTVGSAALSFALVGASIGAITVLILSGTNAYEGAIEGIGGAFIGSILLLTTIPVGMSLAVFVGYVAHENVEEKASKAGLIGAGLGQVALLAAFWFTLNIATAVLGGGAALDGGPVHLYLSPIPAAIIGASVPSFLP